MVSALRRIDRVLAQTESVILIVILSLMVFLSFLQVVLRNFFSTGILWGDTFLRHMVLWITFLGGSLATRDNRHINIDILSRILPLRWRRFGRVLTNAFSALISALLTRASFVFVMDEKEAGSILMLGIPLWWFLAIVVIGFAIITARFLLKAMLVDNSQPLVEET